MIPSFFIRLIKVVRFSPKRADAPSRPPIFPLVRAIAFRICAFSISRMVRGLFSVSVSVPESPGTKNLILFPPRITARSRKLSNYFYLHGMFIFGYPAHGDGQERFFFTIKQRAKYFKKFFKRSGIDTIQLMNAVPLPGSELRARLESEGRLLPLSMVGWDKYDGLFLCYDPRPDGLDAYDLQNMPKILMKKRYLGGFISRKLNYGNWLNWVYIATIGFPIQFVVFYCRRFVRNLREKQRARNVLHNDLPMHTIFTIPLANTWRDIKRRWRNLFIKTYAGGIMNRWLKAYHSSDYNSKIRQLFVDKKIAKKTDGSSVR